MKNLKSTIRVQVDSCDKDVATYILKRLGLTMSEFINVAIKQLIYENGIPFEVVNTKLSKELSETLQEGDDILNGKIDAKGYNNMYELLKDLKNDV